MCQKSSRSLAPGNRPARPTTAMACDGNFIRKWGFSHGLASQPEPARAAPLHCPSAAKTTADPPARRLSSVEIDRLTEVPDRIRASILHANAQAAANVHPDRRNCRAARPVAPQHFAPQLGDTALLWCHECISGAFRWMPVARGGGNALRSSFPFGVSGTTGITANRSGTMYSGNLERNVARAASTSNDAFCRQHDVTHQPLIAGSDLAHLATHCFTPVTSARKLRSPPVRYDVRAVSPAHRGDRGIQAGHQRGSAPCRRCDRHVRLCRRRTIRDEFSCVSSGRLRYPRATPSPPMQSSPTTPIGAVWPDASST